MTTNKNIAMRLLSALLCIFILLSFSGCLSENAPDSEPKADPNGIFASADAFEDALPTPESLGITENTLSNHHYHQLTEEEQLLYVAVLDSWTNKEESLSVKNIDYYLLKEKVLHVISAVYLDHPECYRYGRGYSLEGSVGPALNDDSAKIIWHQRSSNADVSDDESKLEIELTNIVSAASAGKDDYERVKIVHDYLVNEITYDQAAVSDEELGRWRNGAYSALVEKQAICGGYARAFQLILKRLGIPCTTITGIGKDELHAWSLASLDGEYYLFDVTWADQEDYISYEYFAITTEEMQRTHTADKEFTYPLCTATACNYYVREGLILEKYSFEEADRMISAQNTGADTAVIKFTSKKEFDRAYKDLITDKRWCDLAAFKDAKTFWHSEIEEYLIIQIYFKHD